MPERGRRLLDCERLRSVEDEEQRILEGMNFADAYDD